MTEEIKEKERRSVSWSILILGMALLTLVSTLVLCFYGLYGLSTMIHYQKMDELGLEKEIAVINKDVIYVYNRINEMSLFEITKLLRNNSDKYCKSLGAQYGYYSLYTAGNYVNCFYGGDEWKKETAVSYTQWLEKEVNN